MARSSVEYLLARAAAGERLYFDDALQLYQTADLASLSRAASTARHQRLPGKLVTYIVDSHITLTNVCVVRCEFCNLYRSPDDSTAFVLSREAIAARVEELLGRGGNHITLRGAHNPALSLGWYTDLLRWLHEDYPALEIECFSPPEIGFLTQQSQLSTREVLLALQAAGLHGLSGRGAEILDDEIRSRFSPRKQQTDGWLSVMREAHKLGLTTSATMVTGFGEHPEHRIRHLQRLRSLQDHSLSEYGHGFSGFVSWTLSPSQLARIDSTTQQATHQSAADDYLRHIAIARLFLDNILHHQAHWATQGLEIAQKALTSGLDDFGSTMFEDVPGLRGVYPASAHLERNTVHRMIRQGGFVPARRDGAYNLLQIFDQPDPPDDALSAGAGEADLPVPYLSKQS